MHMVSISHKAVNVTRIPRDSVQHQLLTNVGANQTVANMKIQLPC